MTNINCSSNCIFQKNGICLFEGTSVQKITPSSNCAYIVNCKPKQN